MQRSLACDRSVSRADDSVNWCFQRFNAHVPRLDFPSTQCYYTCIARTGAGDVNMQKKLTITIDEEVYDGLHAVIGPRRISRFIETLVKPYVRFPNLEAAYQEMAQDEAREREALEWADATVGDINDDAR